MMKRALTIASIVLFSVVLFGSPARGDLDITEVFVTFDDPALSNGDTITIKGHFDFDFDDPVFVRLGDFPNPLQIIGIPTLTEIKVKCPPDPSNSNIPPALTVTSS